MKTRNTFQQDETIILSAISKLLKDKSFMSLTIGIIATLLTTAVPTLAPYEPIILVGMFAVLALLVHSYSLADVQGAGNAPPIPADTETLIKWIEDLITALNTNTAATSANTSVTGAVSGATITAPVQPRDTAAG